MLAFTLTYVGTLGLAFLMFLGQLAACGVLLAVAGIARLVAYPNQFPDTGIAPSSLQRPEHRSDYLP
jgi:hypothetical protein